MWDVYGIDSMRKTFQPMHAIKKLVICCDGWGLLARHTSPDLFPALSELQLHSQIEASYADLLDFIAKRKEDGQAIETLRLVRDPHKSRNTAGFEMFKQKRGQAASAHGTACGVQHRISGSRILESMDGLRATALTQHPV
ncbi:hypothetical protein BDW22DRAFT_186547 [Trametopsis cervina]|nr:hypothetical protein BDW22DRAFT_186547 [Trametopsis cervina]